jgi:rhodanese-related sulfurtransferase
MAHHAWKSRTSSSLADGKRVGSLLLSTAACDCRRSQQVRRNDSTTRVGMMLGNQVPTVQPGEVAVRVADGWMLLDVRNDDEWADGRIAGSVHIPMDQLMQRLDEVDDRVVCVCAVGARSARVAQFLNAQGREAVNLDGGLYAWASSGLPIEG